MSGLTRNRIVLHGCMGLVAAMSLGFSVALLQSTCLFVQPSEGDGGDGGDGGGAGGGGGGGGGATTPDPLVASAGNDKTSNVGVAVQLTGSAAGGVTPYTYQWLQSSGPALTFVPDNGQGVTVSVSAASAGTAVVQLRVTDAAGTVATDTVNVTVSASGSTALSVTASATATSVTLPATSTLSATAAGGSAPYTYSWLQTSGITATLSAPTGQTTVVTFPMGGVGTYQFTVTVTDAIGATATSAAVTITVASTGLVFTAGTDNLIGTVGNDAFAAAAGALQSADKADGWTGTDALNVELTGTGALGSVAPTLQSIEVLNITDENTAGASTIDAANITGLTVVNVVGSTQALTVSNLSSIVSAGISDSAKSLTLGFAAAAVTGTSDALTLSLSNATGGTFTANGIETFSVASTGGDNTITFAGDALKTLYVTGNKKLTVGGMPAIGATTINASGQTAGGVVVTAPTGVVTFTGGAGDDKISFGAGQFISAAGATQDTVAGGGGTDTLGLASADAVAVAATLTNVTGVERLGVTTALAGNLNATYFSGVNYVTLEASVTGARTITVLAPMTVEFAADSATADDDVTLATSTNGSGALGEAVTIGLSDAVDDGGTITGDLNLNGFESATITTSNKNQSIGGALTMTSDVPGAGSLTTVTVTGSKNLTITGAIAADVFDASALTGSFIMGAAMASASTVTGGSGNDTITGSAVSDLLSGGAGNDTLGGGSGNDTISGGDGTDTITGGTGTDAISGGSGGDAFVIGHEAGTTWDTISDFARAEDVISIDLSEVNAVITTLQNGAPAAVAAGDDPDFGRFTNGAAYVAQATDNIFIIADTDGIESFADVDLSGGITLGGNTANGDGVILIYYDASPGQAVIGIAVDTDSDADATINATNLTFKEMARVTMGVGVYATLTVGNFDFVP